MNYKDQFARAKSILAAAYSDSVDVISPFDTSVTEACIIRINDVTTGTNLSVVTEGGDEVIYKGLSAGDWLPVHVKRIKATGSDVDEVIAHW